MGETEGSVINQYLSVDLVMLFTYWEEAVERGVLPGFTGWMSKAIKLIVVMQ